MCQPYYWSCLYRWSRHQHTVSIEFKKRSDRWIIACVLTKQIEIMIIDLQNVSFCRSWGGHWGPSSAGTLDTPPWLEHIGSPCSLVSRTLPRPHSLPEWSCSGSGRNGNLNSHCHIHSDGPGSFCPQKRQSVGEHSLSSHPDFTLFV